MWIIKVNNQKKEAYLQMKEEIQILKFQSLVQKNHKNFEINKN